jgi:hypothetical protein
MEEITSATGKLLFLAHKLWQEGRISQKDRGSLKGASP